ncbi:MAG: hypothetical protein IPG39_07875 [Bacteroidetes bacterium]|nr:hypothetical protein [Bacteroidota bacterium]
MVAITPLGCTLNGGYFGFVAYGDASVPANNSSNSLINCTISNYYVYSAYNYYQVEIFSEEIFSSALPEPPSVHFMVFMYQHTKPVNRKNRIRKGFEGNQAVHLLHIVFTLPEMLQSVKSTG